MPRGHHGARWVGWLALPVAWSCTDAGGGDGKAPVDDDPLVDSSPSIVDTPVDTPEDTPAETSPGETADTPSPVLPPDLVGVGFAADPALAGCEVASFFGLRANAVIAAAGDLDGDGISELVLANASCPGPSGDVVHPIFAWDPARDGLRLTDGLGDRLDASPTAVSALAIVDFDDDGDADLAASWLDPFGSNQALVLQANDGSGRFEAQHWTSDASDALTAGLYGFGVGWEETDGVTFWVATRDSELGPGVPHHVGRLQRRGASWQLEVAWGEAREGLPNAWAWIPMSRHPNDAPFEHAFVAVNHVPGADDYHLALTDGRWEPSTFVHREVDGTGRPVNALHFATPACTDDTPVCFTPMGGTMLRFDVEDAAGARSSRDCVLIAAGGEAPVYVQCPDPAGGWTEDGALGVSFGVNLPSGAGGTPPPPRSSWQIRANWDVNADGWMDVVVTTGRDFDVRPLSPSYAFLQTPACRGLACDRFVMSELPWPDGHVLGTVSLVVPRADGSWAVITAPSLNAVYADGVDAPRVLRWSLPAGRRWLALRVGASHDLRALGSVLRPQFFNAAGQVLPATSEVLLMPAPTWGMPGGNDPVVIGVPQDAVSAVVDVDLPGCRPTVRVSTATFDAPLEVPIEPCP